jgi:hypothetical protein
MCLAHEVSQSGRTSQPARAMHEFSHKATLRGAKVSRKQAGNQVTKILPKMNRAAA